ncbi:MAG TPA: hypothetical protein VK837_12265 [Longimicrobiales bacterium]|nr:hypothetical protein [Longimicrobiales bacterium]
MHGYEPIDRRRFVAVLPVGALAAVTLARAERGTPARGAHCPTHHTRHPAIHPDPRPGVDASKMVPEEEVPAVLKEAFDGIRAAPAMADGIRCHCGCADIPDYYSLLTCYEVPAMALVCDVCQRQGLLVGRMARDGATLEEIRAAVDDEFA